MKLGPFPTNAPWNSTSIQAWLDRLRTIYNTAYENLQDHIGLGGTAQHPLTNVITAGFAPATGTAVGHFLRDDVTWADPPTVDSSTDGLAPATGTAVGKFLRDDVTWAYPTQLFELAGDQATAADTNPVTLTGLVWTFAANAVYRFQYMGQVSPAAATTGCGFQLDVSAAVSQISMSFYNQLDNTGTLSGGHSIADDASVGVSSGMPGTSTYPINGWGILKTTSNTGTAQLRFRSETTAVTTCKSGFVLVVERLS
jgi:hypothetical protein